MKKDGDSAMFGCTRWDRILVAGWKTTRTQCAVLGSMIRHYFRSNVTMYYASHAILHRAVLPPQLHGGYQQRCNEGEKQKPSAVSRCSIEASHFLPGYRMPHPKQYVP